MISKKYQKIIILSIIFISMIALNMITPLIMDDFNYTYGLDGRINSLKDIFGYQLWFYFNWGGRNIAHFLAQLFLMNNKMVFNIFNAGIYTVMVYLIYSIIKGNKKDKPSYLILIHLALWFLMPSFGQSFIWLTGSCNYLWTTTIILLFLNIFIKICNQQEKYNIIQIILFGVLGILAGWTNENSGASLVFILLAYIIFTKFVHKQKIQKIELTGIIGVILGFIIMIIAPGNFERATAYTDNSPFIVKLLKRFIDITETTSDFLIIPIIIITILLSIYIFNKQKIDKKVYVFIFGTVIAIYSMIVSPTFPERSWTIMIVYMIITCGILLYDLKLNHKVKKFIIMDSIIILSVFFVNSYILVFKDSYNFYNVWQGRIDIIEQGKKKGIYEYEFQPAYTTRKQSASYGLGDLYLDKDDANNKTYARYFGIKSIKAKE